MVWHGAQCPIKMNVPKVWLPASFCLFNAWCSKSNPAGWACFLSYLSYIFFIINMNINQKVGRKNSSYMLRNTTVTRLLKDMQLYTSLLFWCWVGTLCSGSNNGSGFQVARVLWQASLKWGAYPNTNSTHPRIFQLSPSSSSRSHITVTTLPAPAKRLPFQTSIRGQVPGNTMISFQPQWQSYSECTHGREKIDESLISKQVMCCQLLLSFKTNLESLFQGEH